MFRSIRHSRKKKEKSLQQNMMKEELLSAKLDDNINFFTSFYEESSDVAFRTFMIGDRNAAVIYIDGLTDTQKLDEQVLRTLMFLSKSDNDKLFDFIENKLPVSNTKKIKTYSQCTEEISKGHTILLLDHEK